MYIIVWHGFAILMVVANNVVWHFLNLVVLTLNFGISSASFFGIY